MIDDLDFLNNEPVSDDALTEDRVIAVQEQQKAVLIGLIRMAVAITGKYVDAALPNLGAAPSYMPFVVLQAVIEENIAGYDQGLRARDAEEVNGRTITKEMMTAEADMLKNMYPEFVLMVRAQLTGDGEAFERHAENTRKFGEEYAEKFLTDAEKADIALAKRVLRGEE